jgi:hypothetical protein
MIRNCRTFKSGQTTQHNSQNSNHHEEWQEIEDEPEQSPGQLKKEGTS